MWEERFWKVPNWFQWDFNESRPWWQRVRMTGVSLEKVQHQMLYRWNPLCIGLYTGSHRWIIELGWSSPHGPWLVFLFADEKVFRLWCCRQHMRRRWGEGRNHRPWFLVFCLSFGVINYPLFDLNSCMTCMFVERIIWTLLSVTFVLTGWFAIWGDFENWNSVCCLIAVCYRCWVRGSSNNDWKK